MGSEWKEFELGQLLDVVTDIYKPNKKEVLPYLGLEHIEQGTLRLSGIGMSTDIISNKYRFEPNDILFGKLRPYFRKVYKPRFSGVCSTDIMVLRTKDCNIADQSFLFYVIASKKFIDIATASSKGTKMPRADWNHLKKVMIKLPSLPEQRKIASILSAFDDKIELNNEMNKTLEEIAQAIFKHWFIDFEFPNENGEPYKSSGGEFVDSELGPIPKGWRINTIRDICKNNTAITGKTPPTRVKENYGDYMMFITIPDMHGNVFVINTQKKLSRIGANSQKNKTLPPLSICVSCIATPGLVCLTSEPSQTNQQINSIVCKENISPYYIFSLMKNYRTHIINLGSGGTATLNLNKRDFEKIKIIIPETNIMKKYESKTKHLFDRILLNQKENAILSQLRDTLLPKLISGEIRVV
jgi:type I restriction enzyme S subunit